jgi:hypothetical protein
VIQQHHQEIHRLPRQTHRLTVAPELVGAHVELEFAELVFHVGGFYAIKKKSRLFPDSVNGPAEPHPA